jgi:hypothetical protein
MKRKLFQLFNLLMTCVVLLSSTGFGLVEHSCQMRGKKKTMVVAFSDTKTKAGCSIDGQLMVSRHAAIDKSSCCQDESSYENVDAQSSLSQLVAKFVKTVTEAVLAGTVALITYLVEQIFNHESSSMALVEQPPSPSGRDILVQDSRLLL